MFLPRSGSLRVLEARSNGWTVPNRSTWEGAMDPTTVAGLAMRIWTKRLARRGLRCPLQKRVRAHTPRRSASHHEHDLAVGGHHGGQSVLRSSNEAAVDSRWERRRETAGSDSPVSAASAIFGERLMALRSLTPSRGNRLVRTTDRFGDQTREIHIDRATT